MCDLPLADIAVDNSDLEVGILIGSDYYWALTTGQIRRGEAGPVTIEAKLGWVLSGPVCHHTAFPASSVNLISCTHVLKVATRTMNESVDDVNSDQPSLEVLRFTSVVFGVTASPFLLGGTIRHHLKKYDNVDPEFVRLMLEPLYVDYADAGGHDVNEAFDLYVKSKLRFQEGGFRLRKWGSISEELMRMIKENEKCDVKSNVCSSVIEEDQTFARYSIGNQESESDERKVLGLSWDNKNNGFKFSFNNLIDLASELPVTKRSVLSVVARIYDPLGVISPVVIPVKVLFQQICRRKGH